MSRIRAVLAFAVMVLFGVAGCSGDAVLQPDSQDAAANVNLASCEVVVPDDQPTISEGVDAASSGDKVCVKDAGGPYVEQVLINKDLTLQGVNDPTIQAPSDPSGFIIPESGQEWEPVVFAFGGSFSAPNVSGSATVDVSISGFTVDGADLQPDRDKNIRPRLAGILFRNVQSSGGITENTVENLANGGKENFGVAAYGKSDVTVASNTITGYERIGIIVSGAEATGRVRNNTVTTDNPQDKNWAPNGIEFVDRAQGDALNNTVKGNLHPSAASGGILVVGTDGIQVKDNTIDENDYGVGVFTFFGDNPSADDNGVTRNQISDPKDWGVLVANFASGTTVNNNKVTNNTITCDATLDDDDEGVFVWAASGPAVNNKVIGNTITKCEDPVQDSGGDDTKEQANSEPATP